MTEEEEASGKTGAIQITLPGETRGQEILLKSLSQASLTLWRKGQQEGGPPEGQDVNPLPSEGLEPAGVLRWLGMQLQAEQETPGTEQKDNLPCLRASLLPTRSLHRGMHSRFSINKVNPSPVALTPPALSWVAELGGVLGCPPSRGPHGDHSHPRQGDRSHGGEDDLSG